jgi:hypothetical protein
MEQLELQNNGQLLSVWGGKQRVQNVTWKISREQKTLKIYA